jgi:glycosyltransferase involved in cell wall biosynthesis
VTQAAVLDPLQISVVITSYNRAHLLPRALRSLRFGAEGVSHEAIIVDDGSTDDTATVVGELLRDPGHHTLRYIYQPNGGLVSARNSGIAAARAPWVTFLDSDDEYAPGHLARRLPLINASPPPDIIHGGLNIVGGPDWVPDKFDPTRRIAITDCFVGGTFLFRRTLWQQLGGFRLPNYGDDHDFMTRAMAAGARVVRCDAPTYIYHRDSPDSLCNTR